MLRPNWHWLALAGAIVIEVVATTAMKQATLSGAAFVHLLTFGGIAGAYLLLGLAVKGIPLALAYAVWEAAGLVLVAVSGAVLFGEHLTPAKLVCFAGVLLGALLLERGMHGGEETAEARP